MKILFEYIPTEDGYKLDMNCTEMKQLENGAYDKKEYQNCFKAILRHIQDNHYSGDK